MTFPKARNGLVLKSSRSSFDNIGNLSGRRSLSFNVEMVGRNLPISTPKVVEDVVPGTVMLQNMAQEVQPQNKKGRFRFGLPNIRIPFLGRKRGKNTDSQEHLSKCISNPLPMNCSDSSYGASDKKSALHRFDTYDAAEFALREMAVNAEFENMEMSQATCSLAMWSGSTWDHNLFLQPAPSRNSIFISLSDEENFQEPPPKQLNRDWLSSPEMEVSNDWRKQRKSSVRRRPSSAYGAAGNSSRVDRDSASRYASKPVYRKGLDGGSRPQRKQSIESSFPVSDFEATPVPCERNGNSHVAIPSLALGCLTSTPREELTGGRMNESRARGAFGSTIPVLDEFNSVPSKSSESTPPRSFEKHVPDTKAPGYAMDLSCSESCLSSEYSSLDGLDELEKFMESSMSEHCLDQTVPEEESWHLPPELSGFTCNHHPHAREDCIVTSWDLDEVTADYLHNRNNDFMVPCLTAHPDEPDHATDYPTSMSSEDAVVYEDEQMLEDFPNCLGKNPTKGTVLDVLERRGQLMRKEVLCKISHQKDIIRRMKSQVRKSKVAFNRLRQGLGPQLTEKVEKLRQKWGGGLRIRRRKKLENIQAQDEEDLWDLHFNEMDRVLASDSESWATDEGEMVDC